MNHISLIPTQCWKEAGEVAHESVANESWWMVTVVWDDDEIEDAVLATSRRDALTSARANWPDARTITVH